MSSILRLRKKCQKNLLHRKYKIIIASFLKRTLLCRSKFLINNDASATFSSERVVPTAIANDIIMVWGFGTNSIGRFSVVGSYVPSTGFKFYFLNSCINFAMTSL